MLYFTEFLFVTECFTIGRLKFEVAQSTLCYYDNQTDLAGAKNSRYAKKILGIIYRLLNLHCWLNRTTEGVPAF